MIRAQVAFRPDLKPLEGLRSRKKFKTRLGIEDAALALFAEQGYEATTVEQIAERAEVSPTTFFRYFPGKADVILNEENARLPMLQQAIQDHPADENDLFAVRDALQQAWIPVIDAERTTRTARAIASSPVLRGLSYDVGQGWLCGVSEALARREGGSRVSERHDLAARVALGIFGATVEAWVENSCRNNLSESMERNFDTMRQLCCEWSWSRRDSQQEGRSQRQRI